MTGFISALITGLICMGIGAYLTWLWGKTDRKKARELTGAQIRIAQLEDEKNKLQILERFTPRIAVSGMPRNNQFISVTDSVTFRVIAMDYLTADGLKVTDQLVDRAGTGVQIPINESKVTEVQEQGCDATDGSFPMSFRIHIEVDGMAKAFLLPVRAAVNSAVKLKPLPLGTESLKS